MAFDRSWEIPSFMGDFDAEGMPLGMSNAEWAQIEESLDPKLAPPTLGQKTPMSDEYFLLPNQPLSAEEILAMSAMRAPVHTTQISRANFGNSTPLEHATSTPTEYAAATPNEYGPATPHEYAPSNSAPPPFASVPADFATVPVESGAPAPVDYGLNAPVHLSTGLSYFGGSSAAAAADDGFPGLSSFGGSSAARDDGFPGLPSFGSSSTAPAVDDGFSGLGFFGGSSAAVDDGLPGPNTATAFALPHNEVAETSSASAVPQFTTSPPTVSPPTVSPPTTSPLDSHGLASSSSSTVISQKKPEDTSGYLKKIVRKSGVLISQTTLQMPPNAQYVVTTPFIGPPDDTIPVTEAQKRLVVGLLMSAFEHTERAIDSDKITSVFRARRYPTDRIEAVCWDLLVCIQPFSQ